MFGMSSKEKNAVQQFVNLTQASEKMASEFLKGASWNIDRAVDNYYSKHGSFAPAAKKGDDKKLNKIFDDYVDPESKEDLFEGRLVKFLHDVGVDENGMDSLALSWKLNCQEQGIITRKDFVTGFSNMGVDTVQGIKKEVEKLKKDLDNAALFKQFYTWLFTYCTENKRKTIDKAVAIGVWSLTLNKWPLKNEWIEFLTELEEKHLKAVSKDLWLQVLEFSREIGPDLSGYDADAGAWPFLVDMFVDYLKKKRAQSAAS